MLHAFYLIEMSRLMEVTRLIDSRNTTSCGNANVEKVLPQTNSASYAHVKYSMVPHVDMRVKMKL